MKSEMLFEKINYDKAYRKNRLGGALWVLDNPEVIPELLEYCFKNDDIISYKALWVLEFVCLKRIKLIYPYLDYLFEKMPSAIRDQSLRPLSHLCELLVIKYYKENDPILSDAFTKKHKEIMTECCFEWLITQQKVACHVRAMTSLYYLGEEFDWIHPELKEIITRNIHGGSAGYKARGKNVLSKIAKFNS